MFAEMIYGYPFRQRAITKFDAKILDRLITDNLSESATSKIPVYIRRLFANFTNNVQRVEINMFVMNNTKLSSTQFGYLLFKHLFFTDCGAESECIRLPLFLRLFDRSLESIVIFNNPRIGVLETSITLHSQFVSTLLSGCKIITSNPRLNSLKRGFQSIIIMKPKDSISEFIVKHQSDFKQIGWKLEEKEYIHPRRGKCSETLHVSRV